MYRFVDVAHQVVAFFADKIERLFDKLTDVWSYPLLTTPSDRLYSWWIASYVAIGLIAFFVNNNRNSGRSLRNLLKFLFPSNVYVHTSTLLDFKLYLINRILVNKIIKIFIVVPGPLVIGGYFYKYLVPIETPDDGVVCGACWPYYFLYSFCFMMAVDFGVFVSHFLHHKIGFLWEFHKVHHSAIVLTPLTAYRFHPLEKLIESSIQALFAASVVFAFSYLIFGRIEKADFFNLAFINTSIVIIVFNLMANIRHSHIWVSYGYFLNHVFVSPAQHQIHHSCEAKHIDKNFGIIFAVWDWMFGTLYLPQQREEFEIGLTNLEHEYYNSVLTLYLMPFARAGKHLLAGVRARRLKRSSPSRSSVSSRAADSRRSFTDRLPD